MKEKGGKWKSRISKDEWGKCIIMQGICYCPAPHYCSFEGVICICREVTVSLISYRIFYLISKLRSSPRLLRKEAVEIQLIEEYSYPQLQFKKDDIVTTGFKDDRSLLHCMFFPCSELCHSLQALYLTCVTTQKGLSPKIWVLIINCKSLALHSTESRS